jgi:YggT family protein
VGALIYNLLQLIGNILTLLLIVRAILSFFPPTGRASPLYELDRLLYRLTEPVLQPIRAHMPDTGAIDFSPLAALVLIWVALLILRNLLL